VPSDDAAREIAELAMQRRPVCGRTRVVCIDGPAGSGKTTLGAQVDHAFMSLAMKPRVLHMDDFYDGWDGLRPDLEPRLVSQVLAPLAAGRPARWQQYDWHAGRFDRWIELAVPDVLVLEGCGSGARSYDPFRTVLAWVEAARETRIARGVERDGAQVLPHWRAWMRLEEAHFRLNATRENADLLVSTD
jgi:uridine kinase